MALDLHGADMLPTEYFGGDTVTVTTSIFREKANELMCYFCTHGEKKGMGENNGVRCENPQSLVFGRITSATNNCPKNSEVTQIESVGNS